MEENDFKRIEQLVSGVVDAKLGRLEEKVAEKFGQVETTIEANIGHLRKDVNEDFRHHVGILTEDFQDKLQLVAEGHQMLSEKLDRVEKKLENKMDAISAELAAHRADTEGHKRGYMVHPVREKTERSLRMIACYGKENGRHRIRSHISRRLSLTG